MWVNFAKTGDPSTEEYKWENYDISSRATLVLGEEIQVTNPHLKWGFVTCDRLVVRKKMRKSLEFPAFSILGRKHAFFAFKNL